MERDQSMEMTPQPLPPPLLNQIAGINRLSAYDSPASSGWSSSAATAATSHRSHPPLPPSQNNLRNALPTACTSNEGSPSDKSVSFVLH